MKFKLEKYASGKCVMRCKTKEEAKIFCRFLHEHGKRWHNGGSYAEEMGWKYYRENTCYNFNDGYRCCTEYYRENNYTILNFDDFDWRKYKMVFEIKRNDILTFRNGETAMVYEFDGKLIQANDHGWSHMEEFTEDLRCPCTSSSQYDIMKIQRPDIEYRFMPKYWKEAPVVWKRDAGKFFHGMTYEEAHRKMWKWVAEHPDKLKEDWFNLNNYETVASRCFACAYCDNNCEKCPLDKRVIGCSDGLYRRYQTEYMQGNFLLASEYAKIISELPWR